MSTPSEMTGTALLCALDGVITRVMLDQIGLLGNSAPGTAFVDVVEHDSGEKAAGFIRAILADGMAFDWQMNAVIQGGIVRLHCIGGCDGSQIWIIMAKTDFDATKILEEMGLIQSEQTDLLRATLKEASYRAQPVRDEPQFEDLTRLYNDLGKMQRELAHRNAELETMRAKLEAKQAELIDANARLDALAATDGLTGIANRRAFQSRLETECARASRYSQPLSLMILDVDRFKSFNDTYGHQGGDDVLKHMGRLLATSARNADFVARYGGEEFAVILVNTEKQASIEAAERLRIRIETEQWPNRQVTASIGIASWGPGAASATELISMADSALYFSKEHGRNRATHSLDVELTGKTD